MTAPLATGTERDRHLHNARQFADMLHFSIGSCPDATETLIVTLAFWMALHKQIEAPVALDRCLAYYHSFLKEGAL